MDDISTVSERKRVKALIREWDALVEPLTTPIVYHPGGWEDTVPEELKREVLRQRLEKLVNGGWEEATDAEVLCYLYTASLVQPLNSDWTHIYLYVAAGYMPQVREAIPDTPKELTEYQQSELQGLKRKIRASQIKRRKNKKKEENMSDRKLVMEERGGRVLMGVQQEGCDPVVKTVEGDLYAALAEVNGMLTEAQEKWATSPKMPAHKPAPAPKPAAAAPEKAEDLPLLADEKAPEPAPLTQEPTEAPAEAPTEADRQIAEAVATGGTHDTEAEEKVTEPTGAAEEQAPATEVPAATPEPSPEPVEEKTEAIPVPAPAVAQSAAAPTGEVEYWLKDGRGPYSDIQTAMNDMGLDEDKRPHHNRWDRLSTSLKEQIQRQPKP